MKTLSFTVNLEKRIPLSTEPPPWSDKIDRWYQLDELGFSFAEALHAWDYLRSFERPDLVFLAIENASNVADFDFIKSGGHSPAKFVYTLPNISAAVIFQILKMNGKVYCLNHGKETLDRTLNEAQFYSRSGKKIWVFSSPAQANQSLSREILFFSF